MRRWQLCVPDTALVRTAFRLSLEQKHAVHDVPLGPPKNAHQGLAAGLCGLSGRRQGGHGGELCWWRVVGENWGGTTEPVREQPLCVLQREKPPAFHH